jgi:hypothetical protein
MLPVLIWIQIGYIGRLREHRDKHHTVSITWFLDLSVILYCEQKILETGSISILM